MLNLTKISLDYVEFATKEYKIDSGISNYEVPKMIERLVQNNECQADDNDDLELLPTPLPRLLSFIVSHQRFMCLQNKNMKEVRSGQFTTCFP